jgi:hypothetical protein
MVRESEYRLEPIMRPLLASFCSPSLPRPPVRRPASVAVTRPAARMDRLPGCKTGAGSIAPALKPGSYLRVRGPFFAWPLFTPTREVRVERRTRLVSP